jgi:SAM-dependent methyltransferase
MGNTLDEAFERFTEILSGIGHSDLASYKSEFFQHIDRIAELIETTADPERYRDAFFRICGDLDQSLMHGRTRQKPLGYPGDFLLIDWIYTQKTADSGLGKRFDQLFHTYEAAQAVRNRKEYFIRLCKELAEEKKSTLEILDLGCGSCRDVLESLGSGTNGAAYRFHCVDQEPQAVVYAQSLLAGTDAAAHVKLECSNIFKVRTDRMYDLIWSAGLFDYLDNRIASLLIKKCWRLLQKGGWFVFGNFSLQNPTRHGMELVGKWYLLHRSAEELIALCNAAGVPYESVEVDHESLGINLFCKIRK